MNIIQMIIDILTYTPTFYVDGIPCNVDCAWIGAVIGAVTSLAGAAMSAQGSSSNAKQMKKAAQKNYNMLMENAEMSKMTLGEQMDSYKEDMDSYRSSMIQRYGLAGGLRADDAQLDEVRNYDFDTDKIDTDALNKEATALRQQKIDDYVSERLSHYHYQAGSSDEGHEMETPEEYGAKLRKQAEKKFKNSDEMMTEALGNILRNGYEGKQTSFKGTANNSAILNLRTSVTNMQRDINNAYKAGMIDYWQQRENAQNVKDTYAFQAAGYSTQARTTLASGFTSAIQYGAKAYEQYKGIS